MLVLEYKIVASKKQYQAVEEAIRTTQFIRNKCLRYWIDSKKENKINKNPTQRDKLLKILATDIKIIQQNAKRNKYPGSKLYVISA